MEYFELMRNSDVSIQIEPKLLQAIRDAYPGEESASCSVEFLIHDIGMDNFTKKYYIKFANLETHEIDIKDYNFKTAIDTKLIKSNSDIKSIDIFEASLLAQIGEHNTIDNIIEFIPPPIIFVELWRYQDDAVKSLEFDSFTVKLNYINLQYNCIGAIIHTNNHFNTIAFDNNHIILLDDALVSDLTLETDSFDVYRQSELQDLQTNSTLLADQIHKDQFEILASIKDKKQ